eukprot:CAMPEP_0174267058 /NCGR_PEP_ID=MMETSP0439-20130205/32303_1 /TAXON_ID=0 /ORGANISM="Stereomyxa ramosa, Strain Chinc5" /LENGTH=132 /DNA_ID=CAMNT_0015354361 /DNA_START=294 /DNA_END=689 /DNA_ORIENTATION=-
MITGSDDKLVKVWSVHTGWLIATLRGHEGDITDLSIDPENKYIASASNDNVIRVWSMSNFRPVAVLLGHTDAVTTISFSPNPDASKRVLLSTSLDGTSRLWSMEQITSQLSNVSNPPVSAEDDDGTVLAPLS